jgi:hypothetical protein
VILQLFFVKIFKFINIFLYVDGLGSWNERERRRNGKLNSVFVITLYVNCVKITDLLLTNRHKDLCRQNEILKHRLMFLERTVLTCSFPTWKRSGKSHISFRLR